MEVGRQGHTGAAGGLEADVVDEVAVGVAAGVPNVAEVGAVAGHDVWARVRA